MKVCIHTGYIHSTHASMNVSIHTSINISTAISTHKSIDSSMNISIDISMHVHIHRYTHGCMHGYGCIHGYIHGCIPGYIHADILTCIIGHIHIHEHIQIPCTRYLDNETRPDLAQVVQESIDVQGVRFVQVCIHTASDPIDPKGVDPTFLEGRSEG